MSTFEATARAPLIGQIRVTGPALVMIVAGTLLLAAFQSPRMAALFAVGTLMGLTLYHASFGFTAAWRAFIQRGDGTGLRAQMVMLAVTVCLFFPALGARELFGQSVYGFVAPVGVSVAIGAFIFGLGMQFAGGCASGTLFTVGGGSTRMVITLVFFVIGSVLATHHLDWWLSLPNVGRISLIREFGWPLALAANLAVFGAIALMTWMVDRKRRQGPPQSAPGHGTSRFLSGPWPILWGAIGLALLNFATLAIAGRPWGITSAFALWGAKWAHFGGIGVTDWGYWQNQAGRITGSVFNDTTSVMNFGIMLGAFAAAGLAGRFAPVRRLPLGSILAAVIGGTMLGYGARLAFGCNIGAYFSGIASGSVHGWLWLVTGFAGSIIGTRLRPLFGLG